MGIVDIIFILAFIVCGIVLVILYFVDNKKSDRPAVTNQAEPDVPDIIDEPIGSDSIPNPIQEPVPQPEYDENFEEYLLAFCEYIDISRDSKTYEYLNKLYNEAYRQFNNSGDKCLPELFTEENFPVHCDYYGNEKDSKKTFDTIVGWLFALQLAELKPHDRTGIFKTGYELGGYDRYSNVYGYDFSSDPNNARLVAAAIYAGMRGLVNPDIEQMRKEVGGSKYSESLAVLADGKRDNVKPEDFFIDFREFMSTAPGPYAPGYTDRPDVPYPDEQRDDYGNLQVDRDIHESIVDKFNLDSSEYRQDTVQAIADKEGDPQHLFGYMRTTKHYHFEPVFGNATICRTIDPEKDIAQLANAAFAASNSARGILQSASVSPVQYGRLRPGCSWTQEACKNSTTDDRRNVLVNFEIEDGDGCPTGYYDQNGDWVIMNGIDNPEEYEEESKRQLFANSYPSGHSAGIWGVAMALIELMPLRADLIMAAANSFSNSRSIARYHWMSDIIVGRVIGTAQNAVAHASSDYYKMLEMARKELA